MAMQAHFSAENESNLLNWPCFDSRRQQFFIPQHLLDLQSRKETVFLPDNDLPVSSSMTSNVDDHLNFNVCSQTMDRLLEQQKQEVDAFVKLQTERLMAILMAQKRQQWGFIWNRLQTVIVPLLKRREEELLREARKGKELEDFLARLEMENETWKRLAEERAAVIIPLTHTIERLRNSAKTRDLFTAEDGESCCEIGEEENNNFGGGSCRACGMIASSVIFLPCRHLCSCKTCEPSLDCCPVCRSRKKGSIEALVVA